MSRSGFVLRQLAPSLLAGAAAFAVVQLVVQLVVVPRLSAPPPRPGLP